MKEIKTERTVYDIIYEATDGKQFTSREECEKYEGSARAAVWQQFKTLIVDKSNEYSLFHAGCEDDAVHAIKMHSVEDKQIVMQLYLLDNSWTNNNSNGERWKQRAFNLIDKASKEKDVLLVGENCDGEIYIIDTRNSIIERLNNLDKEKE